MSLAITKKIIHHCLELRTVELKNKAVQSVAEQLIKELSHLHKSYIQLYKEAQIQIRSAKDPISRTRVLSFQFVKDWVFQNSLRSELLNSSSTDKQGEDVVIYSLLLLIDDYLSELTPRVFYGVKMEVDEIKHDQNGEDILKHPWEKVAGEKIRIAHSLDAIRSDVLLDLELFRFQRLEELEVRIKLLNRKMNKVCGVWRNVFVKDAVLTSA